MQIYSVLQIGEYHLNNCEDYLIIDEIGSNKILCAVMDGCTTAIDSHFASILVGKLLRKICKAQGYQELYQPDTSLQSLDIQLKSVLKELFKELNIVKNQLLLNDKELLTTLIILLADKHTNQGIVLAIGDGLVSINGTVTNFDQDNKPDYLGFHLDEDFDTWYDKQTHRFTFDSIQDISIATDGIDTFTKVTKAVADEQIDAPYFMLQDMVNSYKEDMLYLKLKHLEHHYGLKPTDDLAVIRIINK